jgi:hypothetical protein
MARKTLWMNLIVSMAAGVSLVSGADKAGSKFLMATGELCHQTYLDPGKVTCIGGVFDPNTGWCTPGTRWTLTRNTLSLWSCGDVSGSAASMFNGPLKSVTNCNLDENLQGECWGTYEWDTLTGGKWKGMWTGKFDLINYIGAYSASGHGHGGEIDDLQMKFDAMSPGGSPCFTFLAQVVNR